MEQQGICSRCGHTLTIKKERYGDFIGCSNFPKCKEAFWDKPTGEKCPNCGEMIRPHRVCAKCGYYKGKDELSKKNAE